MLSAPQAVCDSILSWNKENIPEDQLAEQGREEDPHITLLYGIHTNELEEVEPKLPTSSIEAELGKVGRFSSDEEHDVLFIEVFGDDLHEQHLKLTELEHTKTHDEYKPHLTLAYVKKDALKDLDGQDPFDGEKMKLSTIEWSPAKGEKRTIHIEERKESWLTPRGVYREIISEGSGQAPERTRK